MVIQGDTPALGKLITALEDLAQGETQAAIVEDQAAAAQFQVWRGFESGYDPYGRMWARKKNGERCYLTRSGWLKETLTGEYQRDKLSFTIETPAHYAVYYQSNEPPVGPKRKVIRRPMVPTERGLPRLWETTFRDLARERLIESLRVR